MKYFCSLQNCKLKLCRKINKKVCRHNTDVTRGSECLYKHKLIVNRLKEITPVQKNTLTRAQIS